MKKFNNIFEQINVELPAVWKIQTLRTEIRLSPCKAAELQPQTARRMFTTRPPPPASASSAPAAATCTPLEPPPDTSAGPHRKATPPHRPAGAITKHEKRFTP